MLDMLNNSFPYFFSQKKKKTLFSLSIIKLKSVSYLAQNKNTQNKRNKKKGLKSRSRFQDVKLDTSN